MSAIKISGLSKKYQIGAVDPKTEDLRDRINRLLGSIGNARSIGDFWALRNININIDEGEVLGIIGPNGAGKSTLLKIISQITEPTTGRIVLQGKVASLLEVGTGFHRELTGRENIYLNGTILGMAKKRIHAVFNHIVEFSEIGNFLDTPVKHYSSGMYVRLAFAVAAHLDAEILIIDEVLSVGDAKFQRKCINKINNISSDGRTVLFVSHNMSAVAALCDRVALIDHGELKEIDKAGEVIERYLLGGMGSSDEFNVEGYRVNSDLLAQPTSNGVRITQIEIVNTSAAGKRLSTGDGLLIRLQYVSEISPTCPAFFIAIKSISGEELVRLSTTPISGHVINKLFDHGVSELYIENLPLTGGHYLLDIGIAREGIEWIVRLDNVVELEIDACDVYESGTLMDQSRGMIVVNHHWKHYR